jgi:hypothetical protein
MMKSCSILVLTFCLCIHAVAQETGSQRDVLESAAAAREHDGAGIDQVLQHLHYFRKHPLNLNEASESDLRQLHLLTDLQVHHLIRYRNLLGALLSVYELQAVPHFDVETVRRLMPFISVGPATSFNQSLKNAFRKGTSMVILRWSRFLQKEESNFSGSPDHLLLKYRFQSGNKVYYGLTAEKDAGEIFFRKGRGFDFHSGHYFIRTDRLVETIALGDFMVNFGQGLVQWNSFAFSKGPEVMGIKRSAPVLTPYRSSGETGFNRGAGISLARKNWSATVFGSYRKVSASLADSSGFISSLPVSGLHRTESENAGRHAVQLMNYGGRLSWQGNRWKAGIHTAGYELSKDVLKLGKPYRLFHELSRRELNAGMDYSYTVNNIHLFGEGALGKGGATAFVQGGLMSLHPKVDFSFLLRSIGRGYRAVAPGVFAESSSGEEEKGFYIGMVVRPALPWQIQGYADLYRFPWLRFSADAPSGGEDYLLQCRFVPHRKWEAVLRFRSETKMDNTTNRILHAVLPSKRRNIRFHFSGSLFPGTEAGARMEYLWFEDGAGARSEGVSWFAEASSRLTNRCSFNFRLQAFDNENNNTRIYAFEKDVLFSSGIPGFSGKGFRYYLNLHFEAGSRLACWIRYAQTIYKNGHVYNSAGNGLEATGKSEAKLQVMYYFKKQ